MLESRLFRDDARLQHCLLSDRDHVTKGDVGPHVRAIQIALVVICDATIDDFEVDRQFYGPTTARSVLAYKWQRLIINRDYQSASDDLVGRMTIAALDRDVREREGSPGTTRLIPCQQHFRERLLPNDPPPPTGMLLAQAEGRPIPRQA
jgi:hypothetical protein